MSPLPCGWQGKGGAATGHSQDEPPVPDMSLRIDVSPPVRANTVLDPRAV